MQFVNTFSKHVEHVGANGAAIELKDQFFFCQQTAYAGVYAKIMYQKSDHVRPRFTKN